MKALWPHQEATVAKFLDRGVCYDLSDPGTGKTAAHITAFMRNPRRGRLLVICPKTLMRSAWAADINEFAPGLSYSFADAGVSRFEAFGSKSDVVIMNTDGVRDLARLTKGELARSLAGFTHNIIDENTAFKHPTSQRSKAMQLISRQFEFRSGLSGTPNPISVTEMWHPSLLIDGGKALGKSFYRFRGAMQESVQVGPRPEMVQWHDRPEALETTYYLLRDILVRHEFESVMTHVPAHHKARYNFELPAKLLKEYKQLEKQMVTLDAEGQLTPIAKQQLRSKLLQIASGALYVGDSYRLVDTGRYELICELVGEVKHSLVFFNWKHQRDQLESMFKKKEIRYAVLDGETPDRVRDQIVADYQAGKYDTLLLHPRTGAHGLTLTRGTRCIVASAIYEADVLKQLMHRIYRGTQDQVTNTVLVQAVGTVEDQVYDRLDARAGRMADFLSMVANNV